VTAAGAAHTVQNGHARDDGDAVVVPRPRLTVVAGLQELAPEGGRVKADAERAGPLQPPRQEMHPDNEPLPAQHGGEALCHEPGPVGPDPTRQEQTLCRCSLFKPRVDLQHEFLSSSA
jgi:hypothetical protein